MEQRKVCNLKNEKVKCQALEAPEVPDGLFKLHSLMAFIGCRGSGKTNAAVLLARRYIDDGVFNRIFIISPTYESNPQFETLEPAEEDVYSSIDNAVSDLNEILDKVRNDAEDHQRREKYKEAYAKWKRRKATFEEIALLEANDFAKPPNIPKPCPLLIIDDMSQTPLYQPSQKNGFINLCLRHRHLHKVGITIFMLVQNFKMGIPKCLRQNVQQYFIWPTHDYSQLEAMYEEFANLCTWEQFMEVYREATKEPHSFLTIDLNPINPEERFRRNFDTALVVPVSTSTFRKKREKEFHTNESNPGSDRSVRSRGDVEGKSVQEGETKSVHK
jgi:hypothetical protein